MSKAEENKYHKELKEILVLLDDGGASGIGSEPNVIAQHYFLAYVDTKEDKLYDGKGFISWIPTKEEAHSRSYFARFKGSTIYRLRVRELIDKTVPEGRLPSFYNRFLVVDVLAEGERYPQLESILEEYRRPVILCDEKLGEFTLDKDLSLFTGSIRFQDQEISLFLNVDVEDQGTWDPALDNLRKVMDSLEIRGEAMGNFAAEKFTALANEWQEDSGEKEVETITPEEFSERISIAEIATDHEGTFSIYYNDDDMFWGHIIIVEGNLDSGPRDAYIAG
jgi:hypothetical protein